MDKAFGRYRLLSLIGAGGMGKVYKAHDTTMERDVAIKVLSQELATEPGYEERFRREALMAGRLTEPHIIPVHEAGEIDGRLYLVMPVVDGTDVASLLDRDGPMYPERAVRVIEQLAAALDAAHAVDLVHRDVKPSNALVAGDDFVYLIDFGIAHDAKATKLTQTGSMVGTVGYMSPERLNTGVADARSDVYALACVLYECLTGHQPFPGDSMEQQLVGHLTLDPPKPSSFDRTIPKGFDEVIATGMAKDPEERYQSARELAVAARRVVNKEPSQTGASSGIIASQLVSDKPPTTRPNRKWLIAGVVLLVAIVAVTVVLTRVLSPKSKSELVLTGASDPGTNAFMPPAATPPPTNNQPQPTLQPQGNSSTVATQELPGNRDGLYGGTLNNAECDREKMIAFLNDHPAQASAFVEALNSDSSLHWSGGHPLAAADIPTYLRELTPTVLRLDTRVTNHGFDGTHPTALQSVFQSGTAVLVDAWGVPRSRCYCGNPLTAPSALTGEPQTVGAAWSGFHPGALAAVQPATAAITNFVLVDVVTGQPFNRPVGTTGSNDTPHGQAVAPPVPASSAPSTGQAPQSGIAGTYMRHSVSWECYGRDARSPDSPLAVTVQGNTVSVFGQSGPLNADGSFVAEGPWGPYDHSIVKGVFAMEGGRWVIRDGTWDDRFCHGVWTATKQ